MGNLGCCNQSSVIKDEVKIETLPVPDPRHKQSYSFDESSANKLPQEESYTPSSNGWGKEFDTNTFEFSNTHLNAEPKKQNTTNSGLWLTGEVSEFYTIVSQFGSSCYGNMYKAIHKSSNTFRAIRIIGKDRVKQDKLADIVSEIQILKSIDSPYLPKIYEIIEDDSQINICTNLCTGVSLFEKCGKERELRENDIAEWMYEIMSAISVCHEQNIINGKIDPEHIIFTDDKPGCRINIVNFGISKPLDLSFPLMMTTGSLYYAAPEVFQDNVSTKSDIWSCGVILYILLCGYAPFSGYDDTQTLELISKCSFNFTGKEWSHISSQAKSLVMRMLTKNPQRRLSAQEVILDPWIQNRGKSSSAIISQKVQKNLLTFGTCYKLPLVILQFIYCQLLLFRESFALRQAFLNLDPNSSGKLSRAALLNGYNLSGIEKLDFEAALIRCDNDLQGLFNYTQVINAIMSIKKAFCRQWLEYTFEVYDKTGSGKISISEIKTYFKYSVEYAEDKIFEGILKEADKNEDGELDTEELKHIMIQNLYA
ncbi:unnamed protein product [Blepharisma stoltei]|uniref:Calcium-dependent protein kinase n=1 Tax=Blepharisma stoltei TaxID=1481888 RepID=A0AAU9JFH4_9CILI|nr:unnamed protein product [Blepharisma stoltei]